MLVRDADSKVRVEVARFGNDKHRDILVKDLDSLVRYNVAMHGNDKHRAILSNDEDDDVREEANSTVEFPSWLFRD